MRSEGTIEGSRIDTSLNFEPMNIPKAATIYVYPAISNLISKTGVNRKKKPSEHKRILTSFMKAADPVSIFFSTSMPSG